MKKMNDMHGKSSEPSIESNGFDIAKVLDNKKFLDFLENCGFDAEQDSSEYEKKVVEKFEQFQNAEETKKMLIDTLKAKFEKETGIKLTDKEFEDISREIDAESVNDPESLRVKLDVIRNYNELPAEIKKAEDEIKKLGEEEVLSGRRDQLEESRQQLVLAGQAGFAQRFFGGRYEKLVSEKDLWDDFKNKMEKVRVGSLVLIRELGDICDVSIGFSERSLNELVAHLEERNPQDVFDSLKAKTRSSTVPEKIVDIDRPDLAFFVQNLIRNYREYEESKKLAIENNDRINNERERLDSYRIVEKKALKGQKSFIDKWKVRLALPKIITENLENIDKDLEEIDESQEKLTRLKDVAERLREGHADAKSGLMEMYGGIQTVVMAVKKQLREKIENTFSAVKPDDKPEDREKKLKEAKKVLDQFGEESEYVDDLGARREQIQTGIEAVVDDEVERIFDSVKIEDGAYTKTMKTLVAFLKRRGGIVGDKIGDDAMKVVKDAFKTRLGNKGFHRTKKLLILEVLRGQKINLN